MHEPYRRMTGADTVVLCVHGIQGSPAQFRWLVESLPESVDYQCLLLPGHGGTTREFAGADDKAWRNCVQEAAHELRARYKRVIYVGHSMGCLLGILAAVRAGVRFDGMLLMACPLALRPTVRYAANNWKAAVQKTPSNRWVRAAQEANSVSAAHPIAYLSCIKPYIGLFRLMAEARGALPQLNAPVIAVHSEMDEIVSIRSLGLLERKAQAQTMIAEESGHFLYSDKARGKITGELLGLIDSAE